MAELTTSQLLDVPDEVVEAIATTMTMEDGFILFIAIINSRQQRDKDNYLEDVFRYRAKAIKFYEDRIDEFRKSRLRNKC